LLIGCDLRGISNATLSILGNEEVIAVNQDSLGKQADYLYEEKSLLHHKEVWGGELSNNRYVLLCFNRFIIKTIFTLHFDQLFPGKKVISIRETIDHKNEEVPKDGLFKTKTVNFHAVAMYVIGFEPQDMNSMIA
jgi:alpha-galactosidase